MKRLAVAVFALGSLSSCGKTGGGATPQELFEKSQVAAKAKDWGAWFDLVHPADVDVTLFHFTYIASMAGKHDAKEAQAFAEFMKSHGVPVPGPGEKLDMSTTEKLRATVQNLFKDVKDKRGFFLDTMRRLDAATKPPEGPLPETTIKEVKEAGETARITLVTGDQETEFLARKSDGRWFIGFDR